MKNKIIYQLTVEDIQTVADQELNRELNRKEIALIEDTIAENIDWYDAIYSAFQKHKLIAFDEDDDDGDDDDGDSQSSLEESSKINP